MAEKIIILLCILWLSNNNIYAQPPLHPIQASPSKGYAPLNVNFHVNIADVKSYSWDFGNGKRSDEKSPTVKFEDPGSYDLRVFVEYENHESDTLLLEKYVVVLDSAINQAATQNADSSLNQVSTVMNQLERGP